MAQMGQKNRNLVFDNVRRARPFRIASVSGREMVGIAPDNRPAGDLPEGLRKVFQSPNENVVYAVYSFETPIAWLVHHEDIDPEWIMPNEIYSVTTRNHQSIVRRAINA